MSRPAGTSQEAWDAASDIVVDYGNRTGTVVVSLQAPIARAIDAAILSAKAEQQQKDAMIADVFARVEPNEDDEVSRIVFENANRRARAIASAIRTSSDQSAPANGG